MENRKYALAIKRNNNNYSPLEWHLTPFYHGEDLTTLEGIDNFTKDHNEVEFIVKLLELNMLSKEELFQSFTIIYQEKGRIRELKDGPIFAKDSIIDEKSLIEFIVSNMDNKKLINRIYNLCVTIPLKNEALEKFKLTLNNLDTLYRRNPKAPAIALEILNSIPYYAKRIILVRFSNKILPQYINELTSDDIIHKKVPEKEDKIA